MSFIANRLSKPIFILLALTIFTNGCGAIKRARDAKNKDKIPPGERTVTAQEAGLSQGALLTLDRAVEIALDFNPAVVQAQQTANMAGLKYKDARSGYLPTIDGSAAYRRKTANTVAGRESNRSFDSYSAGIDGNQLIFDFWRTPSIIKQARANYEAALADFEDAMTQVEYNVKIAYYGLAGAQSLLTVAEETERQFAERLEQVKELLAVGRLIRLDVTKADVNLTNARLNLVTARNNLQISRANLNRAMGLAEDPGYTIAEPELQDIDPNLEAMMGKARESNPQLRSLVAEEKAAEAGIDSAIAALFPKLTFSAGISWSGSALPLVGNWNLGPTVTLDIFDGFRNIHAIDMATANLRIVRARRAALEQQIYLDLAQAAAKYAEARQRSELADLALLQATQNLEFAGERYKVGRGSALEITDAQVLLAKAKSDAVQARYDRHVAVAQIEKAMGAYRK